MPQHEHIMLLLSIQCFDLVRGHVGVRVQSLSRAQFFYDTMDCNLLGSSVHGIFQTRILEWVAIPPLGDIPDPGNKPASLVSPALAGGFLTGTTWEAPLEATRKYILTMGLGWGGQKCLTNSINVTAFLL